MLSLKNCAKPFHSQKTEDVWCLRQLRVNTCTLSVFYLHKKIQERNNWKPQNQLKKNSIKSPEDWCYLDMRPWTCISFCINPPGQLAAFVPCRSPLFFFFFSFQIFIIIFLKLHQWWDFLFVCFSSFLDRVQKLVSLPLKYESNHIAQ